MITLLPSTSFLAKIFSTCHMKPVAVAPTLRNNTVVIYFSRKPSSFRLTAQIIKRMNK